MTHDFGFVVLALTDFWARDAGVYTCRASNDAGEAFTTSTITCLSELRRLQALLLVQIEAFCLNTVSGI